MSLKSLFIRSESGDRAASLYRSIVERARDPVFYRDYGVPDSVDGRFEMIALHAFLVFRRLKSEGAAAERLGQTLFDVMFDDLDINLREMGAGDMGVGKRVKAMVQAFYGRVASYERAMTPGPNDEQSRETGESALAAALRRNLYGTTEPSGADVAAMERYLEAQWEALVQCDGAALIRGDVAFGDAP